MNISNPKTTVGGLPLATTWYVNTRITQTKNYIDAVSSFLSAYTDQEVTAATNAAIERENTISTLLSSQSDTNDQEMVEAFCRYITGAGVNGAPTTFVQNFLPSGDFALKEYGYAYLGADKKIAHELMPDISLMDVTTVDVKEIYDCMKTSGWLDSSTDNTVSTIVFADDESDTPVLRSFWSAAEEAGTNVEKVVAVVKALLEKYVLLTQATTGKMYATGDILVVTCYDADKKFAEKIAKEASVFTEVFSQSFIGGGWICSSQTRNGENSQTPANATVKFTKLSFNQGEVISVNNLIPNANGNVFVNLANVLKIDSEGKDGTVIGETLARNIQQIRDTNADENALKSVPTETGLVEFTEVSSRFVFNDKIRNSGYAYTTLDEFATLNIKTKEVTDFISAALDTEVARAKADEAVISAALDTEVARATAYDNYLSGVIGNEEVLGEDVSVTDALLALKQHTVEVATKAEQNFTKLSGDFNTDKYDVLDVYTCVIEAGTVADVSAAMYNAGISVSADTYTNKHPEITGWDTLYADPFGQDKWKPIYNYFGFEPTVPGNDIAEITIGGFTGRILDIYVQTGENTYEKIDADVRYKEVTYDQTNGAKRINAEFVLLGEFNADAGEIATNAKLDKLIIRYTKKHTYEPAAFEVNPLFK